jgi:hypothetical protein
MATDGKPPERYLSLIPEKRGTNNVPKDRFLDRPEKLVERLAGYTPLSEGFSRGGSFYALSFKKRASRVRVVAIK